MLRRCITASRVRVALLHGVNAVVTRSVRRFVLLPRQLHRVAWTRLQGGSHVTRHTSHVTRHTSHVARHTSHACSGRLLLDHRRRKSEQSAMRLLARSSRSRPTPAFPAVCALSDAACCPRRFRRHHERPQPATSQTNRRGNAVLHLPPPPQPTSLPHSHLLRCCPSTCAPEQMPPRLPCPQHLATPTQATSPLRLHQSLEKNDIYSEFGFAHASFRRLSP